MARINYSFEKRQRELAAKRKKEAKRLKKLNIQPDAGEASPGSGTPAESGQDPADASPPVS